MGSLLGIFTSRGGVPKISKNSAFISFDGLDGDDQEDKKHHGGPERAVCVLENELLIKLQSEGHPIKPGTTGENLLVKGFSLRIGSKFAVGNVELEVVSAATPCKTIAKSFSDGYFNRISHKKYPGETRWYCRVLKEGSIRISD
tara:strand:- start:131 stop:562 length:432 start_codon:yes stop_codon:yes gene_type:complete